MKLALARVLVVDDDPVMRQLVVGMLRRMGIQGIQACEDGVSALTRLPQFKPDLILTDVHMMPMGGLEFVKSLRAASNSDFKRIKVLFMSADSSPETIGVALPLGIAGYIVKPPTLEALQAKIENALGR